MRTLVLLLIGMHLIGQVFCQVCHDTNFDGDDDDGNDDNGNTVDDCDEAPNRCEGDDDGDGIGNCDDDDDVMGASIGLYGLRRRSFGYPFFRGNYFGFGRINPYAFRVYNMLRYGRYNPYMLGGFNRYGFGGFNLQRFGGYNPYFNMYRPQFGRGFNRFGGFRRPFGLSRRRKVY